MPYCKAKWTDPDTKFQLSCDLDEGHSTLLTFHYDELYDLEWRDKHIPSAVPYTPTGPLPKIKEDKKWTYSGPAAKVTLSGVSS